MVSWATNAYAASRSYLRIGASLAGVCLLLGTVSAQDIAPAAGGTEVDAAAGAPEQAAPPNDTASTAGAASGVEQPGDPAALTSPLEAAIELDRLMERGRFDAALAMGERMVELTAEEFGRNHAETAQSYVRLADAQRRADEHDLAEASYHAAIDIYRTIDGPFTPLAIEPLTDLGESYHEDREYLNAVSAYDEARTATRRAYGLLAEGQTALLDRMAESLLLLNRIEEADARQLEALRLVERRSEEGSDDRIAAVLKYAEWLRRTNRYQLAREQYDLAIREIEQRYGRYDIRLVQPLLAKANSFRQQGVNDPIGEDALNEARDVLSAAGGNASPLLIAELFRDIGDWYIAFDNPSSNPRAAAMYERAWNTLASVPGGETLRSAWFSGTAFVKEGALNMRGISAAADAVTGSVVVKYDLNVAGVALNAEVVESNPPGLKDADVLRKVRDSRFRPLMRDGELVPGRARAVRFTYPYVPEEALAQARD